jgi:phospholipase/carboxylesterase
VKLLYTAHVPEGDGPFPAVLALHGWGASAHDLLGLAPVLHGGRALVLCPQGAVRTPIGPGSYGYGWFPISLSAPPDAAEFARAGRALREFLEEAQRRYPIDARKLVVLGFSQGGVMALDLFLREPERYAALIALSTWLPASLLEEIPRHPAALRRPALLMHGTSDPMLDVAGARESRKLLIERGLDLTYREYEMGHEIAPRALRDLIAWLDDKVFEPVRLA